MSGWFEILQAGSLAILVSLLMSQPVKISEKNLIRLSAGKNTTYPRNKNLNAWTGQSAMMRSGDGP